MTTTPPPDPFAAPDVGARPPVHPVTAPVVAAPVVAAPVAVTGPVWAGYAGPDGYLPDSQLVPDSALASPWRRIGAQLLNCVLLMLTLVVGYLVWTMVLWSSGTNPGKKLLGLRVVMAETGRTATWSDMLVRSFVFGYLVLGLIGTVTLYLGFLVDAFMVFGRRRQRLVDRMAKTLVVHDG